MTQWDRDSRKQMMREVVNLMAKHGDLHRVNPSQYAGTYGVSTAEVEAELMRHLSEGEGK